MCFLEVQISLYLIHQQKVKYSVEEGFPHQDPFLILQCLYSFFFFQVKNDRNKHSCVIRQHLWCKRECIWAIPTFFIIGKTTKVCTWLNSWVARILLAVNKIIREVFTGERPNQWVSSRWGLRFRNEERGQLHLRNLLLIRPWTVKTLISLTFSAAALGCQA